MEENQLNLDAPLISLRRLKLPTFCNSDKVFSQVGIPLAVPFNWEKKPGQPKENSIPTTKKVAFLQPESETTCHNEEESYSTVKDDSFSMKCSMSGKDESEVKDYFMMGRFLPAAQAIADELPPRTWRKPPPPPPRAQVNECEKSDFQTLGRRLPLDYQYQQEEEEEEYDYDDDDDYAGSNFLSSKACGLIQRLCLKAQGRPLRQHVSLAKAQDEDFWEAVYRYKLKLGCYSPHKSDWSKLMSEYNHVTSCSDSQVLDGSSFLNSIGSTLSPDKHEDSNRESGSSDLCEKVYGSYWETSCCHGRLQGSSSTSPSTERPLNQNSLSLPEMLDYKLEESIVIENSEGDVLGSKSSKFVEGGFSTHHESDNNNNVNNDDGLTLKVDLVEKNDQYVAVSLRPPPLPISPSESWLRRTLSSVSSKGQNQPSFLGTQLHSRKKATWESAGGHKLVTYEKSSNLHSRPSRFVEVAKGT